MGLYVGGDSVSPSAREVWLQGEPSGLTEFSLRLSNSLTVEHNTLGPGVIGHILHNRVIDKSTYAATDSWFHYDQVGSVMDVTDSSADDTQLYQDAWGNPMPDWTSGHWQTGIDRWGHNSKEVDGDTGLVYMFQRWALSQINSFNSISPLPPSAESGFVSFGSQPVSRVDIDGRLDLAVPSFPPIELPWPTLPSMPSIPYRAKVSETAGDVAPPAKAASGVCDVYCNETHIMYSARCVCLNAGDSPWDQTVRGCLAAMHETGAAPSYAHSYCYRKATNRHGRLQFAMSVGDIATRLTIPCAGPNAVRTGVVAGKAGFSGILAVFVAGLC